ncbi:hemolymph lipopolysaccharide-binding protein-like [Bacillus rossius redtenbacheri]|uniref:hemolymph lipopolysaccharide-binding protein-like n=1 Tax=Bacillus rossius redtenbacheri TaxID=93214 RepID=UPI002FDCD4FE
MKAMLAVSLLLAAVCLPARAATVLSSGATGYEYFPGFGFYKFYSQPQTWTEAVQTCLEDGGQLGVIGSQEEAQLYQTLLARHARVSGASSQSYFYVGLTEFQNSRDFLTLGGVPVEETGYSTWASGEPNNAHGVAEKCGSIDRSVKLNDIPCSDKLAFICELKYPSTTRLH